VTTRSLVTVVGAALGLAVPLALLRFAGALDVPVVFLVWPSSVALMVPHVWDSERAADIFFAAVILLNAGLYGTVAFLLSTRGCEAWTSRRLLGRAIVVSTAASVVVITGVMAVLGRPVFYRFPSEYRGWAVFEYANPSCPPLTSRGITQVFEVSASGRFCTSSPLPIRDGLRRAMYAYPSKGRRHPAPLAMRHHFGGCVRPSCPDTIN